MKLFFDRRLGYCVAAPGQETAVTTLQAKAGDTEEIILQFGRSSDPTSTTSIITAPTWTPENLATSSVITVGIKAEGDYSDGDILASSSTYVADAVAFTYTFSLDLNTTEINTALERLDAVSADDIASIDCGFEVTYQVGGTGGWKSSVLPITFTLYHDIIGGAEGTPTDAADPDEYLLKASGIEWYPTITSLTGGTSSDLDSLITATQAVGKSIEILDTDPATDIVRRYILTAGTTAESAPDVIRPDDYATTTNEKVWVLQSFGATGISNVVEDTTPQLGGILETNSQQVRFSKGADVASATALTLGTDGNYFDVTGTTTVTSIGTLGIGTVVKLHFDGILILTHHATDLVLPTGANITTAAGDEAEFVEYAAGDWRCIDYMRASGAPLAANGGISNVVEDLTPQLGGPLDANLNQIRESVGTYSFGGGTATFNDDGNYYSFLETTGYNITSITAILAGSEITIRFNEPGTITAGGNISISANITTAAGDVAKFRCDGTNFNLAGYHRYNGRALSTEVSEDTSPQAGGVFSMNSKAMQFSKGADIASATSLTLGSDGNSFDVTGTTTITSIGTKAVGTWSQLHFDGALTLTHHATDLILPGGANITTAAGDIALIFEYATGDYRVVYQRASGLPVVSGSGAMVKAWLAESTSVFSSATVMVFDDTVPQNTEGAEIITKTITPSSTGNYLKFTVSTTVDTSGTSRGAFAVFKDSEASATFTHPFIVSSFNSQSSLSFTFLVAVASTSSQTWKLRAGAFSGTLYINQASSGSQFSTSDKLTMLIEEVTLT